MDKSCFKGFKSTNAKTDFYSVYRRLFQTLDKEEEMEEDVGTKHYDAPSFGDEESNMQEVFGFYKHWSTFSTEKQFSYVDLYNPN